MGLQLMDPREITPHGYTATDAVTIVRKALPQIEHWMLWLMEPEPADSILRGMLGDGINTSGTIGKWRWERVPCDLPDVHTWGGRPRKRQPGYCWLGLVHVTGKKGEDFHIFSYQRPDLVLNQEYLVSSGDLAMLRLFCKDVYRHYQPRRNNEKLTIDVHGAPDIELDLRIKERPCLPEAMSLDIEQQAEQFFSSAALYKSMDIPYRRGLLFSGAPGTGKTMMVRHLIRQSYRLHKTLPYYLSVNRHTDDNDIHCFFNKANCNNKPIMLIIEEIDSLFYECSVSRSNVLAKLDGISPLNGVMLIATTNNPDRIDSALLHRPSRFDRVWTFPIPDKALRLDYMKTTFGLEGENTLLNKLASATEGWTFAYIKELRVTASFIAIQAGHKSLTHESLKKAFALLDAQFKAGAKDHVCKQAKPQSVGFGARVTEAAAMLDDY